MDDTPPPFFLSSHTLDIPAPLELYIPPCIRHPPQSHHPPPLEKPLRIQIEGPMISVKRLLPDLPWDVRLVPMADFPQPAGPALAKLAFRCIYGQGESTDHLVVRDEYLGYVTEIRPIDDIDYYGITFDHLVPADDPDPETLQINIIEVEYDSGEYANETMPFAVDAAEYAGKKVLAVPRCCQKRKGTTDRRRINEGVADRDHSVREERQRTIRDHDEGGGGLGSQGRDLTGGGRHP